MASDSAPTVDDLRVKLCYICREEEQHDHVPSPPRRWIHPCSCTLIAHEQCLLTWVETKEGEQTLNDLKCPQCGTKYEIESDKPLVFRVMSSIDGLMTSLGKKATIVAIAVVGGAFVSTMYVLSTAYGAYAMRRLVGEEVFNIILTDDPINWPWHAFFNLPLIPISLLLSRTPLMELSAFSMLGITWGTVAPIEPVSTRINDYWQRPQHMIKLPPFPGASSSWPPSPFLLGAFVFPIVRRLYRSYKGRLEHWILRSTARRDEPPQRFEWALDVLRLGVGVQVEAERVDAEPAQPGNENNEEDAENADRPGRTVRLTTAKIGRSIIEALLIPDIASFMGTLLLRLSGKSFLLRQFLAIKPALNGRVPLPNLGRLSVDSSLWRKHGYLHEMRLALRGVVGTIWGGSLTLTEYDPVWWRNAVGMGLFVVAKDAIQLLYLYLSKRERESRRIKSRPFAGIDPHDLDLIRPPRYEL